MEVGYHPCYGAIQSLQFIFERLQRKLYRTLIKKTLLLQKKRCAKSLRHTATTIFKSKNEKHNTKINKYNSRLYTTIKLFLVSHGSATHMLHQRQAGDPLKPTYSPPEQQTRE